MYPMGGARACKEFVPHKTIAQINRRANYIEVKMDPSLTGKNRGRASEWVIKGYDDIIREKYPKGGAKACIEFIPKTHRQITARAFVIKVKLLDRAEYRKRKKVIKPPKLANIPVENVKGIAETLIIDPFISKKPIPPSVFERRLKCEY